MNYIDKREFLKLSALAVLGVVTSPLVLSASEPSFNEETFDNGQDGFKLPPLGYKTNELEPHFDAKTMEIHYMKHHVAYIANLNEQIKGTKYLGKSLEYVLAKVKPNEFGVRNNAGGHYNHSLFWRILSPLAVKNPVGNLGQAINRDFGSFEKFKEMFESEAKSRFGSGWVWLSITKKGILKVHSTANQDNPLMANIEKQVSYPLICLDVWEHSYYLKYQNKRAEYVKAFWNVVNWAEAERRFNVRMK